MFGWLVAWRNRLRSWRDGMGWREDIAAAPTSPKLDTLEEAQRHFPGLTRDEYTLARVVASEFGDGSPAEMCCIADADVTRAKRSRRSVHDHATRGQGYGAQGHGSSRPVSTRLDPGPRHVRAALAVLRRPAGPLGLVTGPPARGIARGATRYFNPSAQEATHQRWKRGLEQYRSCPAAVIHRKWTYGLDWDRARNAECGLKGTPGPALEWVGPIVGVNPWRLALYRDAGPAQDELYAELRKVIESRGAYQPAPPLVDPGAAMLALALFAAAAAGGLS